MTENRPHPDSNNRPTPSTTDRCAHPGWQFLVMIACIFLVEFLVMLLFFLVPELPLQFEAIIDAVLLTLLLTPAVYLLLLRPLRQQIEARTTAEQELHHTIDQLRLALDEVQELRGILPICSGCKKIRDDAGYWHQVDAYFTEHSGTMFSHGLCPECIAHYYPDLNVDSGPSPKQFPDP